MNVYNSMALRSVAGRASLDMEEFESLLDFVEWTGLVAPGMALERAERYRTRLGRMLLESASGDYMRDYQECRLALETAARFQHSSGDALARLILSSLTGSSPPSVLHLSTVDRELSDDLLSSPVLDAVRGMRTSDDWCYLTAFTNTVKHMSLVDHDFHVVLGESVGLRFGAFDFKGQHFPECSQDEFSALLQRVRTRVFGCLNYLQHHLADGTSD